MVSCPLCETEMVFKQGRFGNFWGCLNYPKCKGQRPSSYDEEENPFALQELYESYDSCCDRC